MAATAPPDAHRFETDLRSALQLASASSTAKHQRAQHTIFQRWKDFCSSHHVSPSLSDVLDAKTKLSYLLVFGYRYRQTGQRNQRVRADQVEAALLAVGQGISHLGQPDPRKEVPGSERNHPLLASFYKAMRDEDDPASRVYPVNITILRGLPQALDTDHPVYGTLNTHVINLIIVGFYWLLRPAEYVHGDPEARSQAFRYRDIHFTIDNCVVHAPTASLNDDKLARIQNATLTFSDQKNAVRGEQIGHKANADPFFCPAKALARLALHLQRAGATPDTPIHMHYNPAHRKWYPVKPQHVTNALRHSATVLKAQTGIDPHLISARSLRPGGATAPTKSSSWGAGNPTPCSATCASKPTPPTSRNSC